MNFKCGWYVLYVKPNWERRIYDTLKGKLLEPFLPQARTLRQWSDRKKVVLKPLFPSYVFVNLKSPAEFHCCLSVNGVFCYVSFGREYALVSDKEINQIKFLVGDSNISNVETTRTIPKVGEIKKISYGPLNGLDCEMIRTDNHDKIIVRINSLQQNIIATIPVYFLEDVL